MKLLSLLYFFILFLFVFAVVLLLQKEMAITLYYHCLLYILNTNLEYGQNKFD